MADVTDGIDLPGVADFAVAHRGLGGHWIRLATDPLPGLDEWSRRHLERLAALDALAPAATVGTHLVHVDTRTDNVLLAATGPGGDVLVDWPGAARGAPWIDLVGLLPALHLDGGPPPAGVFAGHPLGGAPIPPPSTRTSRRSPGTSHASRCCPRRPACRPSARSRPPRGRSRGAGWPSAST